MLMLYLSIMILIPFAFGLIIPIVIKPMIPRDALYYYASYCFFLISGTVVNLIIYLYALLNMDIIKWGKTRTTIVNNTNENEEDNINIISFVV